MEVTESQDRSLKNKKTKQIPRTETDFLGLNERLVQLIHREEQKPMPSLNVQEHVNLKSEKNETRRQENRSYLSTSAIKCHAFCKASTHLDHEVAVILRSHHDDGVVQLFVEVNV